MEIRLKTGAQIKTSAAVVYKEIERVRKIGKGNISLQVLVDESKPVDAPLHSEFEWRNAKAANSWRLHQARKIVQSIEILPEGKQPVRGYSSVQVVTEQAGSPAKSTFVFRSIEDVLSNPETRDELLGQAIRDALAFRKRYQALQELAKVFAALDETLLELQA